MTVQNYGGSLSESRPDDHMIPCSHHDQTVQARQQTTTDRDATEQPTIEAGGPTRQKFLRSSSSKSDLFLCENPKVDAGGALAQVRSTP
jgi:hypothetical protein